MVFLSASPVCFFNLSLPFGFVNLYLQGHPQFSFVCHSKMNLFYFMVLQLQSCLHPASCLPHRLHTSWKHLVVFFWCENAIQGRKKVASSLDTSAETKVAAASTLSAHNSEKLFSWLCSAVFSAWSSCSFHHNYGAFHTLTSLSIKEADWLWVKKRASSKRFWLGGWWRRRSKISELEFGNLSKVIFSLRSRPAVNIHTGGEHQWARCVIPPSLRSVGAMTFI